jgi:lipopolysaccharide/colanic/teichoic acid biosynthesis glycosyltransferase
MHDGPYNDLYLRSGKRFFDIALSLVGLLVLSPFFAFIALVIKATDRGPVFYSQARLGKGFVPFALFKFRTMIVNADEIGPAITSVKDQRITRIGRFLRKTKLDELPQLFNVLRGDMSLVGPRPEVERYVNACRKEYEEILKVRPGITDYATIEFRNEEEILKLAEDIESCYLRTILPKKILLYKKYIREMGFMLDLKLIFLTLQKIISQ